jgi:hypothetical protein
MPKSVLALNIHFAAFQTKKSPDDFAGGLELNIGFQSGSETLWRESVNFDRVLSNVNARSTLP